MPRFQYRCGLCGQGFVKEVPVADRDLAQPCCCGGACERAFAGSNVTLDGKTVQRMDFEHPEVQKMRQRNVEYYNSRAADVKDGGLELATPAGRVRSDDPEIPRTAY